MDTLVEGAKIVYMLSRQDAENINEFIANHPDLYPAGASVVAGQRLPATIVLSRGPHDAGEERLAVQLDDGPEGKKYHVWAADLHFDAEAWTKAADEG